MSPPSRLMMVNGGHYPPRASHRRSAHGRTPPPGGAKRHGEVRIKVRGHAFRKARFARAFSDCLNTSARVVLRARCMASSQACSSTATSTGGPPDASPSSPARTHGNRDRARAGSHHSRMQLASVSSKPSRRSAARNSTSLPSDEITCPRQRQSPSCVVRLEDRTGEGYLRSWRAWRFRCFGGNALDNEFLPHDNELGHVRHHVLAPSRIKRVKTEILKDRK